MKPENSNSRWSRKLGRFKNRRGSNRRWMKTCQKLGLSFWHYLGDRLGIGDEDHLVAPLASMVAARA
jgi:hypothetical protein